MLFASITEMGFAPKDAVKVLDDLSLRAKQLEKEFPFDHYLITTFGNTDLIEVALFNHYIRFAQASSSSAQAFRRSVGVYCPEERDLPAGRRPNVCTVHQVLKGDVEGKASDRPFLAVVFMGLSPIADLCVPPGSQLLAYQVLKYLCVQKNAFWDSYGVISEGNSSNAVAAPEPLIAPLTGLDSVELVLLVRASRLEQLAALAWAVRSQTLGGPWPSKEQREDNLGLARLESLLGQPLEGCDLERHWDRCPLYRGTRTVVGMGLRRPGGKNNYWDIAECDWAATAADEAAIFMNAKYLPGFLGSSVSAERSGGNTDLETIRAHEDQAGDDRQNGLLLFGQADFLHASTAEEEERLREFVRPRTVGQICRFLSNLSGLGGSEASRGIWTTTTIAVRISIPREQRGVTDDKLPGWLRQYLRDWRETHLHEEDGWTQRWLRAAKVKGISYSATAGMVNVIHAVLNRLDDDSEEFADLLPAIEHFVDAAEDKETDPSDIVWLAEVIQRVVGLRGRRDQPLQPPQDTLAFESHAGHRLPREAFIALAETLAKDLGRTDVLIRDTPGESVSSRIATGGWDVIGISPLKLYDPIHWLVGHELAHGCLAHTSASELGAKASVALNGVTAGVEGLRVRREESLDLILRRIGNRLQEVHGRTFASAFAGALSWCLGEMAADLCFWESLKVAGEERLATHRRFWFVHGPGLVSSLVHRYGSDKLFSKTLQTVIFRCILFTHLTESVKGRPADRWWKILIDTLEELDALAPDMRLGHSLYRWDGTPPPKVHHWEDALPSEDLRRLLTRLQCLKEDLRVSDGEWVYAVRRLLDSVKHAQHESPALMEFVDNWLTFIDVLSEELFRFTEKSEEVRKLYAGYLDDLIDMWDTADPWPPFVQGHELKGLTTCRRSSIFGTALSHRGMVLVAKSSQDPTGGQVQYQKRTLDLVGALAEHARRRRYGKIRDYLREQGIGTGEVPVRTA